MNNQPKMTAEQKRESDLIDDGHAQIMQLCEELGMNPSESITIQFRLVLFGVVRMTHNALEERIAALEAKADPFAGKYARPGRQVKPLVPIGQAPSEKGFKP